jgi:ADP-ribose pyrophosphatase
VIRCDRLAGLEIRIPEAFGPGNVAACSTAPAHSGDGAACVTAGTLSGVGCRDFAVTLTKTQSAEIESSSPVPNGCRVVRIERPQAMLRWGDGMLNPIRVVSSRMVHEGNLVRLREDRVVLPRGSEAVYEYVEIKHGSSVLAMEEDGDVWLVREWKYAIGRPSLEVVSGGIEPGETPEDAAHRELREELGKTAAELVPLGHADPFTTMLRCPNYLFLARGLGEAERMPEEAEAGMELRRVPLGEAYELAASGEITHGSSCVAIFRAAEWVRRGGRQPR